MDTRRKTVYRLSELDELMHRLQEPWSPEELRRRQLIFERIDRFRESTPVVHGDVKDWIRAERGELEDG